MTDNSAQLHMNESSQQDPDKTKNIPDSDKDNASVSSDLTDNHGPSNPPSNGQVTANVRGWLLNLIKPRRKRYPKKMKVFQDYFEMYYFHLINEYNSLPKEIRDKDKDIADRVKRISKQDSWEWHDVFDLEMIILELQPLDMLRRRAWILREQYKDTVPPELYKAYLDSKPPEIDSNNPEQEALLRADLFKILHEFHWFNAMTLIKERLRGNILNLLSAFLGVVILISIFYLIFPLSSDNISIVWLKTFARSFENTPAVLTVLLVGILGGIVSTLFRLANTQTIGSEPIRDIVQLQQGRISVFISPILGGVFAVVLFVIFAGGFLNSTILPTLTTPQAEASNIPLKFFNFFTQTGPVTSKDSAILLIWSFLAGFAERLVPDALDRIAKTSEAKLS